MDRNVTMRRGIWFLAIVLCLTPSGSPADDQPPIDLSALEAWKAPQGQWVMVGDVQLAGDDSKRLTATPGTGVLWNGAKGRTDNLVSRDAFDDVALHLEFLVPKGSNSGVKFHGHYEIQIKDSWGIETPTASDCGGIYPRAELKPKYHHIDEGFPPKTNAARRPGEWQTLEAVFRAPRFDTDGKKTENARFVKVVLNGKVIHENLEVPTPTGNAWRNPEMTSGPLLLQADHGPVAFRNLQVRPWKGE